MKAMLSNSLGDQLLERLTPVRERLRTEITAFDA